MTEYIGRYHNGVLRNPVHPGGTIAAPLLSANGKYCYLFGVRVISSQFGYSYKLGTDELKPVMKWLNGYCYFAYGNSKYLWYSTTWGWVITTTSPGVPPIETWTWDDDTETTGKYTGDVWYSGTLPALDSTSSFIARGSNRGTIQGSYEGNPVNVTTTWEYWQRDSEATSPVGIYKPKVTATGTITIGLPQFIDDDDETYVRSLVKVSGYYTYGGIHYNLTHSKWIYGTYGSDSGWWEGDEPNVDGTVTFTFTINDDSDATGEDFTVEFDQYVIGDNTQDSYFFNVGKWHKS
jgi:hypothetical protein